MNRHQKSLSSYPAEKMSVQESVRKSRKRKDAIQDEGKSKAHRTETTETTASMNGPVVSISKDQTPTPVMLRFTKSEDQTSAKLRSRFTKSKDRTLTEIMPRSAENPLTGIFKPVHAVRAKTSSLKYLEVCNEKPQHGDTEEECISETRLNTRPSPADDTTQQSKRDVQYKQTVQTGLSGEEETQASNRQQTSKLPLKKGNEKRPLFNGSLNEQTFTERGGKKIKSDCNPVQNTVQIDAETRNKNKSNSEVKVQIHMSFKQERMKGFWKGSPLTVDKQEDENYIPVVDQPFDVDTSWKGCATQSIKNTARESEQDVNFDVNTPSLPMEPADFLHYAKIVDLLIHDWYTKADRNDVFLKVGKFTVQLQSNNLYCCPFNQDEKEKKIPDRQLSYATLTTSANYGKNYSQTVWNYMVGNHNKVNSHVQTPQDAIALCAILFSEVIRYPNMFFHNILMMENYKTWGEFCDYHPMVKGGTWGRQRESRDISQKQNLQEEVKVPKKVKKREHENLVDCVRKMMKEKRGSPFKLKILNTDVDDNVTDSS